MIDPIHADLGRRVIYRDLGGRGKIEEGYITSFTRDHVFVRYSGCTSAATRREDLEWSQRLPEHTAVRWVFGDGKLVSIDFVHPPEPPWLSAAARRQRELEQARREAAS